MGNMPVVGGEYRVMDAADRRLWEAWRERRDEEAFSALVRPHLAFATDFARRTGCGAADADDVVQQVLVDLAREPSDRPVRVGLRSWLGRGVRCKAMTLRRASARRRHREREAAARRPAQEGVTDPREEVELLLRMLPEPQREAVVLRYLHDLDYREIGQICGATENACRIRVHKGIERLRQHFGQKAGALVAGLALLGGRADAGSLSRRAVARTGGVLAMKKAVAAALLVLCLATSFFFWGRASAPQDHMRRNIAEARDAADPLESEDGPPPRSESAVKQAPEDASPRSSGLAVANPAPAALPDNTIITRSPRSRHAETLDEDEFGWERTGGLVEMAGVTGLQVHHGKAARVVPLLDRLSNLYYLDLWASDLGDAGLARVGRHRDLMQLRIGHTKVTDAAMAHVGSLSELRLLWIHDTALTDKGLRELAGLPRLRELDLRDTSITDAGLVHVARIRTLLVLLIEGTQVRGPGLRHLVELPLLEQLDISEAKWTDGALAPLAHLPQLQMLDLNNARIDDESYRALGRCRGLTRLLLGKSDATDADVAHLAGLRNLRFLDLSGTQITDASVEILGRLRGLKVLDVRTTDLTWSGVRRLHQALPNCELRGQRIR